MKKMAVFVEGQTEQIFVEKLLEEVAGKKHLTIEKREAIGGSGQKRTMKLIQVTASTSEQKFFASIVDSGSDNRVKSDIVERYEQLTAAGFRFIVGIRDVFPEFSHAEVPRFRTGLLYRVKTSPVQVVFVLGVMEVETWFITEYSHFPRIHPGLTLGLIRNSLGFDPSIDDVQLREHPSEDLDAAYRLVGERYSKNRSSVQRTVGILDYERVYVELPDRIPDFQSLLQTIDNFLNE